MRNLSILLVVVTMVAATASGVQIFSEDFSSGTLGIYQSSRTGASSYPYTNYATATNVVTTRSGSDQYSMELHPLWPSSSPKFGRSEGYISLDGQGTIGTNAQFTVDQWVYVPKAEIVADLAVGGLWANDRDDEAILRSGMNVNLTFNRPDDPALDVSWPDEQPGSGAWWALGKGEYMYDGSMPDSMDLSTIKLRLFTEHIYFGNGNSHTYINTYIPTDEWVHLKINHDLTNGTGANDKGTARVWGWKEDGSPLDWSGATISLIENRVPKAISCGSFDNGTYIDGTYNIDDYVMTAGTAYTALNGDLSGDGSVTGSDLDMILAKWGQAWTSSDQAGTGMGDPNMDGVVSGLDLDIILAQWGQSGGPVPEPITLTLLGFGGLALLRRRRR